MLSSHSGEIDMAMVEVRSSASTLAELAFAESSGTGLSHAMHKIVEPRVRGKLIALNIPLHDCGVKDSDLIEFRIEQIPVVVKVTELPSTFRPWGTIPPEICYVGNEKKRTKSLISESAPFPDHYVRGYKESAEKVASDAKWRRIPRERPKTPPNTIYRTKN